MQHRSEEFIDYRYHLKELKFTDFAIGIAQGFFEIIGYRYCLSTENFSLFSLSCPSLPVQMKN